MDAREKTARVASFLSGRTTLPSRENAVDSRSGRVKREKQQSSLFRTFEERDLRRAFENFKILYEARVFDDFLSACEKVQTNVNDDMFLYVMYLAVLHRDDCRDVSLPAIEELAPQWFFASETIHEATQRSIHRPDEDHTVVNYRTAETTEPESRLAYYREDVGMNVHHWAWHVVYPFVWDEEATGKIKDRKGELFYYMHQQMMARYDCERLSNNMDRVVSLENFQDSLIGYAPHLNSLITGTDFGFRPHGMTMTDLPYVTVQDLELWRLRILDAIDNGCVRDTNCKKIPLMNERGIDILGAVVEASSSSVNRRFYGDFHNMGHNLLASVNNPDNKFTELDSVLAFSQTSARDPVFYQWHKYIDDIFQRHKATLQPYTREELSFKGIRIESAEIKAKQANVIETFMREARADLSNAPFLRTTRNIMVTYEHLDHEPFSYSINILNETQTPKQATVRMFLGPKSDESGNEFDIAEQRRLMIELDRFQIDLYAGKNVVRRHSGQSSVTLQRRSYSLKSLIEGDFEPTVDYCSCGWPDHLLVPRGSRSGADFVLFVMCTDYTQDRISQVESESNSPMVGCRNAVSYCGSKDQKYPDKKPMGFPFDRPISGERIDFLTDNMVMSDITIRFMGRPFD